MRHLLRGGLGGEGRQRRAAHGTAPCSDDAAHLMVLRRHPDNGDRSCPRTSCSSWPTISATPTSPATDGATSPRPTSTASPHAACASLQAYANSAVCSATRLALITGRYQYRLPLGLEEPLAGKTDVGLPPEHPTLPSLLRNAGYATALIGKWHLGVLPTFGPLQERLRRFLRLPRRRASTTLAHATRAAKPTCGTATSPSSRPAT